MAKQKPKKVKVGTPAEREAKSNAMNKAGRARKQRKAKVAQKRAQKQAPKRNRPMVGPVR